MMGVTLFPLAPSEAAPSRDAAFRSTLNQIATCLDAGGSIYKQRITEYKQGVINGYFTFTCESLDVRYTTYDNSYSSTIGGIILPGGVLTNENGGYGRNVWEWYTRRASDTSPITLKFYLYNPVSTHESTYPAIPGAGGSTCWGSGNLNENGRPNLIC